MSKTTIKLFSRETTKWDKELMKQVKCKPYYKGLLGSDSYQDIDGRLSQTNAIAEGKRRIDRLIAIKPYIAGFVLYHRGRSSNHYYSK